jgi:hypothetical protein
VKIPDEDHVARQVGGSKILPDGSADGAGFRLRAEDDGQLSINWMELFSRSEGHQYCIDAIAAVFQRKGRKVGSTSRFFVLNVGNSKELMRPHGYAIEATHQPLDDDESHGYISGLEDDAAADLLAQTAIASYAASPADPMPKK